MMLKDARNGWCRVGKRECRHVSADPEVVGTEEHDERGQVIKQAEIVYHPENEFCNDANRSLSVILEERLGCPLVTPYDYLTKEARMEVVEKMRSEQKKHRRRRKRGRPRKRKTRKPEKKPVRKKNTHKKKTPRKKTLPKNTPRSKKAPSKKRSTRKRL